MSDEKEKRVHHISNCPECGSGHIIKDYQTFETVCEDCGLVIEEKGIDHGAEWRVFDSGDESKVRAGPPSTATIHDKGLPTDIDWRNRDSSGNAIPAKNRAQLYRLRKWQRRMRVANATDRNLAFALSELDRMASNMGLTRNVRESAAMIYRKAVAKNLIRGRSIESVVAASLYAACRERDVPRTLDEIAAASRVGRKEIGRVYRFVSRELRLGLNPTSPKDYVKRFCSELHLSEHTTQKTIKIINDAERTGLTSGRGPTGVAAAAIYIASMLGNERRTQREIAEVAGVTEVTIRNRYKELTDKLNMEINVNGR